MSKLKVNSNVNISCLYCDLVQIRYLMEEHHVAMAEEVGYDCFTANGWLVGMLFGGVVTDKLASVLA